MTVVIDVNGNFGILEKIFWIAGGPLQKAYGQAEPNVGQFSLAGSAVRG